MNKIISTAVIGVALAIIGAATNLVLSGQTASAAAQTCADGTDRMVFDGTVTGRDTLTVYTKGDKPLCNDTKMNFTTFKLLNPAYNGKGFHDNPTAVPQKSVFNQTITLKKGSTGKTTVKVQVPDACTNYQIDAYIGPAQTDITDYKEGLEGTAAIVGKIFSKTKTNCTVQVCNPATGQIITVAESEASKYKPVGDIACKPDVKVCNPATGTIITVKASEASKYKPVGDDACKDLKVCDLNSGKIITIKASAFDSKKYSKDLNDKACQPKSPEQVNVCDTTTGEIVTVDKDKSTDSKYKPVNDVACNPVPETPETPETPTPETPEVLPSTGPAEALSALFGTGSLAGAATAYVRSRRALRK